MTTVQFYDPASIDYASHTQEKYAMPSTPKSTTMYPNNGATFSPTGSSVIEIPIKSAEGLIDFRESYLKFTVTVSTADASVDYSAYSLFDTWTVRSASGGGLIDQIGEFGLYMNKMIQARMPDDVRRTHGTFMGCSPYPDVGAITTTGTTNVLTMLDATDGTYKARTYMLPVKQHGGAAENGTFILKIL